MIGIQIGCPKPVGGIPNINEPETLFVETILKICATISKDKAVLNYLAMWSLVHGLISINIVTQPLGEEVNSEIIHTSIHTLINSSDGKK